MFRYSYNYKMIIIYEIAFALKLIHNIHFSRKVLEYSQHITKMASHNELLLVSTIHSKKKKKKKK